MRKHAVLASVSKRPAFGCGTPEGKERLLSDAEVLLRRAKRMGANFVAFPEVYPQLVGGIKDIEPANSGTLDRIQDLAYELQLYIIWPRYETSPEGPRNTSILVSPKGEVVGRYYKVFPTIGEIESGIVPGTSCPVFETEFGKVAMIICFDLNFIELRDELRSKQPDVVFFSSMYRGGIQLQEWALDLGCYMVSAISAELGRIIDRGGKILKLATYEALIAERVNLNQRQLHMDYNWNKMDNMLEKYAPDLTFDYYTQEAMYVIGYEGEDRDVDDILREFGLEFKSDYFARSRQVRQKKLEEIGL